MFKKSLFYFGLFLTGFTYGQNSKESLLTEFNRQRTANQLQFNHALSKGDKTIYPGESLDYLSGYIQDTPYFYTQEDRRANMASFIENLQNGEVGATSIDGESITVLLVDGGKVFEKHGEFTHPNDSTANRIYDLENGAQGYSSHATSVAGFIAAVGRYNLNPTIYPDLPRQVGKGVLPKASIKHFGFSETSNGHLFQKFILANVPISNHSYGINPGWSYQSNGPLGAGWYFPFANYAPNDPKATFGGSYYINDSNYDKMVYTDPYYIIVKSAGNSFGSGPGPDDTSPKYKREGNAYLPFEPGERWPAINCSDGAYCIGWGSMAKNIITVAATHLPTDVVNYQFTGPESIVKAGFSSAGPRKDGAIKPEIAAIGVQVWAPTYSSNSTSSFSRGSGTSFSAPKVTGAVGALTELKRKLTANAHANYTADEMRAILFHNTMEAGLHKGPDNWFGWGFLDAKKAAEFILDVENKKAELVRESKSSGMVIEKIATSDGTPLKVSLSWIDPAVPLPKNDSLLVHHLFYNTTSSLVNDFDLRVIDLETNTTYFPWKLDLNQLSGPAIKGDNTVDNYEQILIEETVKDRKYRIVISSKGKLVNDEGLETPQFYVLGVSGIADSLSTNNQKIAVQGLHIYPTVATDVLNIQTAQKVLQTEIFDLTGKKIQTTNNRKVIDVRTFIPGIYIVRIQTEQGIITKKFIKN